MTRFSLTLKTKPLEFVSIGFAFFLLPFLTTILQFEHVYAIGFKERTDKRDFLTLAASVTGFKVEWQEGVKPKDLLQKAMPNVCLPGDSRDVGIDKCQHRERTLRTPSLPSLQHGAPI